MVDSAETTAAIAGTFGISTETLGSTRSRAAKIKSSRTRATYTESTEKGMT